MIKTNQWSKCISDENPPCGTWMEKIWHPRTENFRRIQKLQHNSAPLVFIWRKPSIAVLHAQKLEKNKKIRWGESGNFRFCEFANVISSRLSLYQSNKFQGVRILYLVESNGNCFEEVERKLQGSKMLKDRHISYQHALVTGWLKFALQLQTSISSKNDLLAGKY